MTATSSSGSVAKLDVEEFNCACTGPEGSEAMICENSEKCYLLILITKLIFTRFILFVLFVTLTVDNICHKHDQKLEKKIDYTKIQNF